MNDNIKPIEDSDIEPSFNNIVDPIMEDIEPVMEDLQPVMNIVVEPVREEIQPIIMEPVVEPFVEEMQPVTEEIQPMMNPVVEPAMEEIQPVIDTSIQPSIGNAQSMIDYKVQESSNNKLIAVNKVTYCLLAFFLGGFGIHKFYAGKTVKGVLSLLFFWTLIPAIVALIDFIKAITKKEDSNGNIFV